ncbi:MAG: cytochrome c oxidase subunit II [Burkholderiales bacterium]|nr:cytochrome c oxidase subunit II [Burkholderiales bacterium]
MITRTAHTLLALALSSWAGLAFGEMRFNLQDQKTALGHAVYDLHNAIVVICLIIFIVVFGLMLYSIWKHRKSVGHQAAHFHENTTVEVLWTVIPFLILLGMAYPATKTLLAQRDTSSPDLTVKVTGYQWKWQYEYLDENISFYSTLATPRAQIENVETKTENYLLEVDNEMVVPVGKKVRVLLTAGDVIHAWYVPALAVKQDSIPGFVRDTWFRAEEPGVYRGQCAELCGKEHAYMPVVVRVVSDEDYAKWVTERKAGQGTPVAAAVPATATDAAPAEAAPAPGVAAVADGKAVYDQACLMCHAAGVAGAPKVGDKAAWAPRSAKGLDVLYTHAIGGFNMMPPRGGNTALSDEQVKAAVDHMLAQSR